MLEHPEDERYAAFYAGGFGRLARDLRQMVGADAEDLAQKAFLVARDRWDVVATLDRPDAWVDGATIIFAQSVAGSDRTVLGLVDRASGEVRPATGQPIDGVHPRWRPLP